MCSVNALQIPLTLKNMTAHSDLKIHSDALAASSHTVIALDYKEIIEDYSEQHWITLKQELIAKGNDFICEQERFAFFGIDAGNTPHDYIHLSWDDVIDSLDCVE